MKLRDGARTTLHVASYERDEFIPRVRVLAQPTPLVRWCGQQDVRHAIVGGFFLRPEYAPLGQVRIDGEDRPSIPFDAPWSDVRPCLHVCEGEIQIVARRELDPAPRGDLLQAGPLLVAGGRRMLGDREDPEGFSATAHQFDSDITRGRYPRSAFGVAGERLLAVVCDGRTDHDAGMTLAELADAMIALEATDALNLDGGGSASLVHDGRLRNRPREQHGADLLEGRAVVSAIVFEARQTK